MSDTLVAAVIEETTTAADEVMKSSEFDAA